MKVTFHDVLENSQWPLQSVLHDESRYIQYTQLDIQPRTRLKRYCFLDLYMQLCRAVEVAT